MKQRACLKGIRTGHSEQLKMFQEKFLCERGEEKIKIMRKEETKRVLEEERSTFNRITLVIQDLTWMVEGSTFSFQILSGENGLGSLSKCFYFLQNSSICQIIWYKISIGLSIGQQRNARFNADYQPKIRLRKLYLNSRML